MNARSRAWLATSVAAAAATVVLAPLLWMIAASLMTQGEAAGADAPLWPSRPTVVHYWKLFTEYHLLRPALNSALVASVTTVLALLFTAPAGYAFAKLRFTGRQRILQALLAALVIPGQVAMLPLFLLMRTLGLGGQLRRERSCRGWRACSPCSSCAKARFPSLTPCWTRRGWMGRASFRCSCAWSCRCCGRRW